MTTTITRASRAVSVTLLEVRLATQVAAGIEAEAAEPVTAARTDVDRARAVLRQHECDARKLVPCVRPGTFSEQPPASGSNHNIRFQPMAWSFLAGGASGPC